MPSTSDFKRGLRILLNSDPWVIVSYNTQSPSARGANTLVKAKLRNLRTQQLIEKTFKSGERIEYPDFEIRKCQYLYVDDDMHYFMDEETFEQFPLAKDDIAAQLGFLRDNDGVKAMFFEGQCLGIEVAQTVTLLVARCDPGIRGDTVNNVTKPAKLETGIEIQVPLFVEEGDKLIVDTRDCRYIRRA